MINKLNTILEKRMQIANAPVVMFGILGFINYPIFYFIWHLLTKQSDSGLSLRLIAAVLCLCLIIKDYWPSRVKKYLPLFWYFTVIYCLPFFGSYMFLENQGSIMWISNEMLVIIWLILSVDWISFFIVLPIGVIAGWLFYFLSTDIVNPVNLSSPNIVPTFINYVWAIVIAAMMTQNKEKLNRARFQGMKIVGASIAHELRTPLVTIHSGIGKIKDLLPRYIETYAIAQKNKLPIPCISKEEHKLMTEIANDIYAEANFSDIIISMLLMNLNTKFNANNYKICSINECIQKSIKRYPFQENEKEIVHCNITSNFRFMGQELLVVHILFNLMKNAFYTINEKGEGEITISTDRKGKFNLLIFQDTGKGIPASYKSKIFDQYFSLSHHGKGIGLAFCKLAMESLGGKITLDSVEGQFTRFHLYFPLLNHEA